MNEYFLSYNDIVIIVVVGVIVGALLGLIPFLLGRRRNKGRLGLIAMLASAVAGAVSPILSLIIVGIFTWIIVKDKSVQTGEPDATHDAPSE